MKHFAVLKNSKRARARRVLFLFLGSAIAAWAGDPVLGTWELNLSKSNVIFGLYPLESHHPR